MTDTLYVTKDIGPKHPRSSLLGPTY